MPMETPVWLAMTIMFIAACSAKHSATERGSADAEAREEGSDGDGMDSGEGGQAEPDEVSVMLDATAELGVRDGGDGSTGDGASSANSVEMKPCETKVHTAGKPVPDFMIVLDRSGSMRPTCLLDIPFLGPATAEECKMQGVDCQGADKDTVVCGGKEPSKIDRWAPAVSAIKSLTTMLQTKVNFGLTVFPGEEVGDGGTGVPGGLASCAPGKQYVPVGLNTAEPIAKTLDGLAPTGATPTAATLQEVLNQIMAKKTSPGAVLPPQYVLLVTDGAPTCVGNQFQPQSARPHQDTIAAIDALAKAGVKTYVIGYDTSVDTNLAKQLSEYAQHGGTNNFYAVQDGPSWIKQFTAITGFVADCSYMLDQKPGENNVLRVELDGNRLEPHALNGWSIAGNIVTLRGTACASLGDNSRPHALVVTESTCSDCPQGSCANPDDCPLDRCLPPAGDCIDGINEYHCTCNPGYSGVDCQIDSCTPNPCLNGGTCSRTGKLCSCPTGYDGLHCELDACASASCLHGGVCRRTSAGPVCDCDGTGFDGAQCQYPLRGDDGSDAGQADAMPPASVCSAVPSYPTGTDCAKCICSKCTSHVSACWTALDNDVRQGCVAVQACAEAKHCTGADCYCGIGVSTLTCAFSQTGACRKEVEAAVKSTDPAMIQSSAQDAATSWGRANLIQTCERTNCTRECGL